MFWPGIDDGLLANRHRFPGVEEVRMLRAIARTAVLEALRQGEFRAAFRGFNVRAQRQSISDGYAVTVVVTCGMATCAHDNVVVRTWQFAYADSLAAMLCRVFTPPGMEPMYFTHVI